MTKIELAGQLYEVDENGFLQETGRWNKDVALAMAAREGIPKLTRSHWKVINFLRDYYQANDVCPTVRTLVHETGFTLKRLYDLFPEGPAGSACKWAGMPHASECA